jgi:hypothetical protein
VIDQLQKDRGIRPDLFHFFGSISAERLETWIRERKLVIPFDLKEFWIETGGGDLFESETVLGPFASVELGDDVDSANRGRWQEGMPADWLVFHDGLGLSVVLLSSGEYANVREGSHQVQETFSSLNEWYTCFIRKEYAPRYGLPQMVR